MSKLIMEIKVRIIEEQVNGMKGDAGEVLFLPFTGTVDSEIFKGEVLPGGVDVQTVDPSGMRHMCARYLLKGVDCKGEPCTIYVENQGYFEPNSNPSPFHAHPRFMTDSKELSEYLSKDRFRAEGHPLEGGVKIQIFDAIAEE